MRARLETRIVSSHMPHFTSTMLRRRAAFRSNQTTKSCAEHAYMHLNHVRWCKAYSMLQLARGKHLACATAGDSPATQIHVNTSSSLPSIDWQSRRKQRTVAELVEVRLVNMQDWLNRRTLHMRLTGVVMHPDQAARRVGVACEPETLRQGLQTMEHIIPGFQLDLESMKGSDWVSLFLPADTCCSIMCLYCDA